MPKRFYKLADYDSRRSIGYLLRHAGKLMTSRIETLFTEKDISFVQWAIMMHLQENLSKTAAELSQHLCHDSGALTRVIDQMQARDWLARERNLEDRRMIGLKLTAEGRRVMRAHLPKVLALYNDLLEDFTAEETHQFVGFLQRLNDKMAQPLKEASV